MMTMQVDGCRLHFLFNLFNVWFNQINESSFILLIYTIVYKKKMDDCFKDKLMIKWIIR